MLQVWVSLHTVLKTTNLKSCQQRFLSRPPNTMFTNNSAYTVYYKHGFLYIRTVIKTVNLKSCQQHLLSKTPNIMFANNSAYMVLYYELLLTSNMVTFSLNSSRYFSPLLSDSSWNGCSSIFLSGSFTSSGAEKFGIGLALNCDFYNWGSSKRIHTTTQCIPLLTLQPASLVHRELCPAWLAYSHNDFQMRMAAPQSLCVVALVEIQDVVQMELVLIWVVVQG